MPLAACITSDDAPADLVHAEHPAATALALALLYLLQTSPGDPRVLYYKAVCEDMSHLMLSWLSDSLEAGIVAHTVAWNRSRCLLAALEADRLQLAAAGFCTEPEDYLWAHLVVRSRSVTLGEEGALALIPGIDVACHDSVGPTAHVELLDGHARLVSVFSLDPGDSISRCYDPDADFADLFERYGFFDTTAIIHTAEVPMPTDALATDGEAWRDQLIEAITINGCDAEMGAWWVPDTAFGKCPLFAVARALFVSASEMELASATTALEVLSTSIDRELEARALVAGWLRAHLANYESPGCPNATSDSSHVTDAQEAAQHFVAFEKRLLTAALLSVDDCRV